MTMMETEIKCQWRRIHDGGFSGEKCNFFFNLLHSLDVCRAGGGGAGELVIAGVGCSTALCEAL